MAHIVSKNEKSSLGTYVRTYFKKSIDYQYIRIFKYSCVAAYQYNTTSPSQQIIQTYANEMHILEACGPNDHASKTYAE
jgi:hypothetical protein